MDGYTFLVLQLRHPALDLRCGRLEWKGLVVESPILRHEFAFGGLWVISFAVLDKRARLFRDWNQGVEGVSFR